MRRVQHSCAEQVKCSGTSASNLLTALQWPFQRCFSRSLSSSQLCRARVQPSSTSTLPTLGIRSNTHTHQSNSLSAPLGKKHSTNERCCLRNQQASVGRNVRRKQQTTQADECSYRDSSPSFGSFTKATSSAFSVYAKTDRLNKYNSNNGESKPTAVAATAFHAFLRQHNSPYVRPSVPGRKRESESGLVHSPYQLHSSDGAAAYEALPNSAEFSRALDDASTQDYAGTAERHTGCATQSSHRDELNYQGNAQNEVLREWDLSPTELQSSTDKRSALSTAQQKGQQQRKQQQIDAERQRRHKSVEQARINTLKQLSDRHRPGYERTALHAYQLLKNVEGSLLHWSQQRRRLREREYCGVSCGGGNDNTKVSLSVNHDTLANATTVPRVKDDGDAVDARFFEYAGQIQRTLHQLTPRHFDTMRGYRLPSNASQSKAKRKTKLNQGKSSSPTEVGSEGGCGSNGLAVPSQLFHLRLLWRLLHITQLFYAIGRHAGLPRSAVHSYVQSANCAYGIREVLRVLGAELGLTSLGLSTTSSSSSNTSSSSSLLSRDELFQIFYASLCISSEEAPGVPIYDPAVLRSSSSNSDENGILRFQLDCIATSAAASRVPIDEWCVRWWCHVYATHNALRNNNKDVASGAPSSSGLKTNIHGLLTMGQAMDVVRASLYAAKTTEVGAAAGASSTFPANHANTCTPLMYFETPPRGSVIAQDNSNRKCSHSAESQSGYSANAATAASRSSSASTHGQRSLDRRYKPHLVGALGGDRTLLRIPYHLGQRFVTVFLEHLLSSAATASHSTSSTKTNASAEVVGEERDGKEKDGGRRSATSATSTAARVEAGVSRLLQRHDRDAVRDVALLCTAILYFEVFSASTAAFMAHAAPLCREHAVLLSGHEISCILLAYATLQRWEGNGATVTSSSKSYTAQNTTKYKAGSHRGDKMECSDDISDVSKNDRRGTHYNSTSGMGAGSEVFEATNVPSTSAATGRSSSEQAAEDEPNSSSRSIPQPPPPQEEASSSFASSSNSASSWHLFYVTLGSRAGQLADTLSEEDVARVLRAMELVGLEHQDLRSALESSLRMRNLGRRVLYET